MNSNLWSNWCYKEGIFTIYQDQMWEYFGLSQSSPKQMEQRKLLLKCNPACRCNSWKSGMLDGSCVFSLCIYKNDWNWLDTKFSITSLHLHLCVDVCKTNICLTQGNENFFVSIVVVLIYYYSFLTCGNCIGGCVEMPVCQTNFQVMYCSCK